MAINHTQFCAFISPRSRRRCDNSLCATRTRNKTDDSNCKVDIFHVLMSDSVTVALDQVQLKLFISLSSSHLIWCLMLARVSRETSVCLFMLQKTVRQTSAGSLRVRVRGEERREQRRADKYLYLQLLCTAVCSLSLLVYSVTRLTRLMPTPNGT